jgi:hypothetical protein
MTTPRLSSHPPGFRSQAIRHDKHIYEERIATRYGKTKTAASFAGILLLAGAMVRLR